MNMPINLEMDTVIPESRLLSCTRGLIIIQYEHRYIKNTSE